MTRNHPVLPFVATLLGIGFFSAMDAAMKAAALAAGVYSALLLRNLFGAALMLPVWLAAGRPFARGAGRIVHLQRAAVVSAMAALFFYGIVRLPLAEAIALSFIAPLIALYFAALVLGEVIRPRAVLASALGLAGTAVIVAGRLGSGTMDGEAQRGLAAILVSAVLYALNLVLQRKQAQLTGPVEIAFVQSLLIGTILLAFAPWLFVLPGGPALAIIALASALASAALLLLAWGYARAEAQALVPIEYTGFLWAAALGWLVFAEPVGLPTVAGAVLIVAGCWIAARKHTEQTAV